jgi:hypothetical protein
MDVYSARLLILLPGCKAPTLSLSTLDGAKVATVVSGTWMGSPVRGLRAMRADRTDVPKEPKPTSDTARGRDAGRECSGTEGQDGERAPPALERI